MDNQITNKRIKSRLFRLLLLTCIPLFSLYCFVLAPLYTYTCADIIYAVTVIPELLGFALDIVDILAYSACFSIVIYSVYRLSLRASFGIISTVCAAIFFKYTANLVMSFILDGAVITSDIPSVVIYFALDLVWLSVITAISNAIIKRYHKKRAELNKASLLYLSKPDASSNAFPFKKFIDINNPLQLSALIMGAVMGGVHMGTRVIYDLFYGLPTSLADALWMITYYVSDIVSAVVMYAIALFIFMKLNDKEIKDVKA